MENEQDQLLQEVDNVEEVTIIEEKYEASKVIRAARQTKNLPNSACVVLVTSVAKELLQVEALPDWDSIHA